jgi:hypothetical protein
MFETPAIKEKLPARIAISGPGGAGKTMSALRIARGVVGPNGKIGLLDTERRKAALYAKVACGADGTPFFHEVIDPPYDPKRLTAFLIQAGKAGLDALIVDSLSPFWAGQGGLLEQKDAMDLRNEFGAWKHLTPVQTKLVDALLDYPGHLIVTMRSKQEYAMTKDEKGKNQVERLGMAPVQREGMEFEFDVFMEMDLAHFARVTKTRFDALDGVTIERPGERLGEQIVAWLNDGVERPPSRLADCKSVEHVKHWCESNVSRIAKADDAKVAELREQFETKAESLGLVAAEALSWAGIK